jgi:hypothetical protein
MSNSNFMLLERRDKQIKWFIVSLQFMFLVLYLDREWIKWGEFVKVAIVSNKT